MNWFEYITQTAVLVGSLTTIGGALLYGYNKFIGAPRERRRMEEADRRAKERDAYLAQVLEPLRDAINDLTKQLDERKRDTKHLYGVADINSNQINDLKVAVEQHDNRLIKLEVKNGLDG